MMCCLGSSWDTWGEFPLPEQAADFLLAALDGDESLSAQLTGQAQPRSAAAPPLRQALAIYQKFGSPHAPRVEELVRDHDL
jgi:hypothetical protein